MKKFFLLMALVLTAGVVHAQDFGQRTNLKKAEKLEVNFNHHNLNQLDRPANNDSYGWDGTNGNHKLFWSGGDHNYERLLISADEINAAIGSSSLLEKFENFVIRVYDLKDYPNGTSGASYSIVFKDAYNNEVCHLNFWKEDTHIAPLLSLRKKDSQGVYQLLTKNEINSIKNVYIKCIGGNGQLQLAEAYFISAYQLDFTDNDNTHVDIGNAYIDPSYLIRTNRLWVEIDDDRSFTIKLTPGTERAFLYFSLPYYGIDMSQVSYTTIDVVRNPQQEDNLWRFILGNRAVDLHNNTNNTEEKPYHDGNTKFVDVRTLYNSRFNADFDELAVAASTIVPTISNGQLSSEPVGSLISHGPAAGTARQHINNIYWDSNKLMYQASELSSHLGEELSAKVQDICITKNHVQSRTTRQFLDNSFTYHTDNNSPCAYHFGSNDTSHGGQIYGYWDGSITGNYVDLSSYKKMRLKGTPNTQVEIRYGTSIAADGKVNSGWKVFHAMTDANGEVNVDLHPDGEDGFYLNDMWNYEETNSSKYIISAELFKGEGKVVDLQENMFHLWNDDDNYLWQYGTIVRWNANLYYGWGTQFEKHFNTNLVNGDVVWGTGSLYPEAYADLTGYKAIRIYGTGTVRIVFNTTKRGSTDRKEKNPLVLSGEYTDFDISNFDYFHLNGIKAVGSANVTKIQLVENEEADYVLYGNGNLSPAATNAINDITAKVVDARARCNNSQDIQPFSDQFPFAMPDLKNKNALYITRDKQFHSKRLKPQTTSGEMEDVNYNWIMPSNPANPDDAEVESYQYFTSPRITLWDGYYFYAPKKIKADETSFERTFTVNNQDGVVNSIILPFAVNADNYNVESNNKNYGFYETFGVKQSNTTGEKMAGILNEQDVKTNDWMIKFKQKPENTDANTPYLYAVKESNTTVFTGVATEDNKVIIPETPNVGTSARDNMTNYDEEVTVFDGKESFYLRGVYEPTYMENILFYSADGTLYRTPYMTVTPFRTIIKSPIDVEENDTDWHNSQGTYFSVSGNVKVVLALNVDDESLDINSLVADGIFAEDEPIYNVAGQRVNTFDKGIYIVGGKKILVK